MSKAAYLEHMTDNFSGYLGYPQAWGPDTWRVLLVQFIESLVSCCSYTWEVPITVVSATYSDWDARPTHYLPFGDDCAYYSAACCCTFCNEAV